MNSFDTLWTFNTKRFSVVLECELEQDADISWDDTGEVAEKLESGEWTNFCFRVRVLFDGNDIACNYLGNSIYADPADFRDHIGSKGKWGSYFSDMVHQSIDEARKYLGNVPKLRAT